MTKYALICLALLLLVNCKTSQVQDPSIFSVGNTTVSAKEFLYVYHKNNFQEKKEDSVKALRDYLDLFVNFKLKVKEAESQGLDTTKAFKTEFEGYRKQLAQPYLTDKDLSNKMITEAYDRLKTEINASHILIGIAPAATPADTLKAFEKITELRKRALAGEDFQQLARTNSHDSSARFNGGNLGYFTSMQMVYQFENAAFNTPKDQISEPIRTQYGYHILKVNDTRPSQGSALVAHIMIRTNPEMTAPESEKAKEKALKIYEQLQNGAKWEEAVKQFSEDATSKVKDGKLEWFSVGGIVTSFENAAFSLQNPGDISKPVQTPYGWHIIKLLEKKPLESFEKMQSSIKSKINRDSRSAKNKELFISRLKKEYNFSEKPEGLKVARIYTDSLEKYKKLPKIIEGDKAKTLFSLGDKTFTLKEYYDYLQNQSPLLNQGGPDTDMYKQYINQSTLDYEEGRLDKKYEDYKMLTKEYREGILLFSLMDENVWSKAVKDSVGLKTYYEKNKEKYTPTEVADVIMLSFADSLDRKRSVDSLKVKNDLTKIDLKKLEEKYNLKNPLRLNATRDTLDQAESLAKSIEWKVGESYKKINGRYAYVNVLSIFKPQSTNFEDIRGQVISDYQKYLEDEWISNLKKKYPVVLNKEELKKLGIVN